MALNIKPFEGPRAPDWTDPVYSCEPAVLAAGPSAEQSNGKEFLNYSDTHLLLAEDPVHKENRRKLKRLDIL